MSIYDSDVMVVKQTKKIKCCHCQWSKTRMKDTPDRPCHGNSDTTCLHTKGHLDRIYDPVTQIMWINEHKSLSYKLFSPFRKDYDIGWSITSKDFEL